MSYPARAEGLVNMIIIINKNINGNLFSKFLGTFSRAPTRIGITVPWMFHNFVYSLARSRYFSSFWLCGFPPPQNPPNDTSFSSRESKLSPVFRSGLSYQFVFKSQTILCVSVSWTDSGLCKYYLLIWRNFSFLHTSQWITFPAQTYLLVYSFYVILLLSLTLLFRLYHHLTYTCCSSVYSQFSLWHNWFLWYNFELLLFETQFLFSSPQCVTISSHVQCP